MKKKIILLLISVLFLIISCGGSKQSNETGELEGEIVFWHSFTQGPRNEFMKQAAEEFMKKHPKVKIKIEHLHGLNFTLNGQQDYRPDKFLM